MIGKWHLGHADRKYWLQNRGFDHFYGSLIGEVDYFTKDRGGIDWQRNGRFLKEKGYFTTQIGDETVKLINQQDTTKPLFLYFASLAPHFPNQAPQADVDAYKDVFEDETKRTYAAMITSLDTVTDKRFLTGDVSGGIRVGSTEPIRKRCESSGPSWAILPTRAYGLATTSIRCGSGARRVAK